VKPRLLYLAAGVSLLLAVVIVALWVRSRRYDDSFWYWWVGDQRRHQYSLESHDCQLRLSTRTNVVLGAAPQALRINHS